MDERMRTFATCSFPLLQPFMAAVSSNHELKEKSHM